LKKTIGEKMNPQEKFEIIKRNTQEILTEEELMKLLETKEQPAVYLGTSVTGNPSIAYLIWGIKLYDFLKAGLKVKVLLADIHGALDNTPWDILEKRYEFYSIVITGMIESLGGDLKNFEIVKGSDIQTNKDYVMDLYKLSSEVSVRNATKASSDVVKHGDNPKVSGIIYPLMQSIDEVYLDVDIQLGAQDQRKIFVLASEFLPKIGHKKRIHVLLPFIRGLTQDGKMSSSVENSKIDFLEDFETISKKLNNAYCPEGDINNGVFDFVKYVIMTIKEDKNEEFVVDRPEKWGGPLRFKTKEDLERSFLSKELHPLDLKKALALEINKITEVVRNKFKGRENLIKEAYPDKK
jgi:tyrosyl-tRNA synthetase